VTGDHLDAFPRIQERHFLVAIQGLEVRTIEAEYQQPFHLPPHSFHDVKVPAATALVIRQARREGPHRTPQQPLSERGLEQAPVDEQRRACAHIDLRLKSLPASAGPRSKCTMISSR